MNIIKTHNVLLHGKLKDYQIILRPLCDKHLPLLYKWNSDPEVLFWTEGNDIDLNNIEEYVHDVYGYVSQNAYCFLIEVDNIPIGDCWLQKMNIPEVIDEYPNQDIRRIDITIGEKDWWSKGIGTAFIGMLTDFAFIKEKADIIFNFIADFNKRSQKVFEKNGYKHVTSIVFNDLNENQSYHCILTKSEHTSCLTYDPIVDIKNVNIQNP